LQFIAFSRTSTVTLADYAGVSRNLGLGTHLFVKVPRPGDSKMTFLVFESSCHLLLPV